MRAEFVDELTKLASIDDRVMLLTADLGFSVVEQFAERFPDRFINVGVAEQNLIGVATGLAHEGFIPFVYSIATFASMRPYEFIRNGPVLHQLPVRIIGTGGGVDYGHGGVTHFALEDVAILRAQPDLTVVVPADVSQARAAVRASVESTGPIYYRVARHSTPIQALDAEMERGYSFGSLTRIGDLHPEVAFLAIGPIAQEALAASGVLRESGIPAAVGIVSTFNPFPGKEVADFASEARLVVTVEAHYRTGGLGSAVAEELADRGMGIPLLRRGVSEMPRGYSGSADYLAQRFGLHAAELVEASRSVLAPRLASVI